MDALKFIEDDIQRSNRGGLGALHWIALMAASFPVIVGLGLRESFGGAFEPREFIPHIIAALILGEVIWLSLGSGFSSKLAYRTAWAALVLVGLLACAKLFYPLIFPGEVRTSYLSSHVFWIESMHCFSKGSLTAAFFGAGVIGAVMGLCPLPMRRWRVLLSVIVGISGAVMLGFHCDSSSWGHVLVGHLGPGVLLGVVTGFFQEYLFRRRIQTHFSALIQKLRNPSQIG
jgi:hypothetical protein